MKRSSMGFKRFLRVVLLFTVILTVISSPFGSPSIQAAGSFNKYYYGSNFYFKVYVPSNYSSNQPAPLMVMLHGCMQTADNFAAGTRMNELAEQENFIVLYPEMNVLANGGRCWNWFYDYNQHRGSGEPAIIKGMVDWVKNRYQIDNNKVYVSGLSAGATMSVIMGATYPDTFKGVGVHSGLEYDAANSSIAANMAMLYGGPDPNEKGLEAYREMGHLKHRMPVIVFHGTKDGIVNPINGEQVVTQWIQTNDYVDDGIDNNSVDPSADETNSGTINGKSYTQRIYHDSFGKPLIEKWDINGLAHAWSGGSSSGTYTDPQGPDASRLMWRFFTAQSQLVNNR